MSKVEDEKHIMSIERPDGALWTYYLLRCLLIPPLFPILVLPFYFRYHTLRYRFGDQALSMRWGILFRREIILNYARIQDIHLTSNIVERWLGLARIMVQTASSNSAAEITIEGLKQFEAVRDFLYFKMRGVSDNSASTSTASPPSSAATPPSDEAGLAELTASLKEVTTELRAIRAALTDKPKAEPRSIEHV